MCQWLHSALQSHFTHFPKLLLRNSQPIFQGCPAGILFFRVSQPFITTLQLNFKTLFECFTYIYDCNHFLSSRCLPAYLCKYLLYVFYHIEWLGMWVLELVYKASNVSSVIYKLCDLIQGIWSRVYWNMMCEDNNRNCLIHMVVVRIKRVNESKVFKTLIHHRKYIYIYIHILHTYIYICTNY